MGAKEDPPLPDFYLSPGVGVSCLHFIQGILNQDWLLAGLVSGDILVYNCTTWKLVHATQVFLQGVLWIGSSEGIIVCQGRFESLKVLEITQKQEEDVHDAINSPDGVKRICLKEKAVFCIAHEGFCKGFLDLAKDFLIFAPSSCSSILVSKLKDTFIRPVSTLRAEVVFPEAKFGALTAFSKLRYSSYKNKVQIK
ncbi:uncharacterized protein LOC111702770 [Eurytemora carolleeae]|uniref:uncharacterized protein LOC111702770 n=1 Tax=Eurytemora carolleeae TaxID=1294199 RepID=UPI000C75D579|nr:uncharacterized protein LOC111702770 [Eurytemora carolleeae]|eukprot:XP_023330311.1 uncharacterized protein LOC111702770 [Eurytemora affinis]